MAEPNITPKKLVMTCHRSKNIRRRLLVANGSAHAEEETVVALL